jgi:hypothetical protein
MDFDVVLLIHGIINTRVRGGHSIVIGACVVHRKEYGCCHAIIRLSFQVLSVLSW